MLSEFRLLASGALQRKSDFIEYILLCTDLLTTALLGGLCSVRQSSFISNLFELFRTTLERIFSCFKHRLVVNLGLYKILQKIYPEIVLKINNPLTILVKTDYSRDISRWIPISSTYDQIWINSYYVLDHNTGLPRRERASFVTALRVYAFIAGCVCVREWMADGRNASVCSRDGAVMEQWCLWLPPVWNYSADAPILSRISK